MSKITYTNKEYIYENAEIPEINKITDGNMNEIKSVVNTNDNRLINAEAVIGNETDTYSASSTYALGSLVIYNNSLLYKCTTAITVAEAWNSAKWTQVSLTSLANDGDVYSTNEIIIGTWIDGKPLYRKVIDIGYLPNASQSIINHNIVGIEKIVKLYGIGTRDSDKDTFSIPYVTFNANNSSGVIVYANNTSIFVTTSTNRSLYNGYIILEYTKTTD